jgi:hypothetical protein
VGDYETGKTGLGQTAAQLPDAAEVVHWVRINHGRCRG